MKTKYIFIFLFIISSVKSQTNHDVFHNEFIKNSTVDHYELKMYYSDLMDRFMLNTKDTLKYGLLDKNGKIFYKPEFSWISHFIDNRANIVKDSIPGLLFKDKTIKFFPDFDATYFHKGELGIAVKNNKYGFINLDGEIIIPLIYDNAFPFFNEIASVKIEDRWFYINKKNELIKIPFHTTDYHSSLESRIIIYDTLKSSTIKKFNNTTFSIIEYLNNIKIQKYKRKLYDLNSKKIYDFNEYEDISGLYINGYMRVYNNKKFGALNIDNKNNIPVEYDEISEYQNGYFLVKKGKWGIINKKNKIVIPLIYDKIFKVTDKLIRVELNQKSGYIDLKNNIIIDLQYDLDLNSDFSDGLAMVKKNGKYGFINKKGEIVIPFIYEKALPFKNNKAIIFDTKLRKYYLINKKGEKISDYFTLLWKERNGFMKFSQ